MKVEREEILHIANLAHLNIEENEVSQYIENLENILNFANVVDSASIDELDVTVGANELVNVFRKDEIDEFEDKDSLLLNAPKKQQDMFEIPKVIN